MEEYGPIMNPIHGMNVRDKYHVERSDIQDINKRIDMLKKSIQTTSDDDIMRQFRTQINDSMNKTTLYHD